MKIKLPQFKNQSSSLLRVTIPNDPKILSKHTFCFEKSSTELATKKTITEATKKILLLQKIVSLIFLLITCAACGSDQPVTQDSPVTESFNIPNKKAIYGKTPLECESGTALTWGSFGQFFFEKYCTSCHSKQLDASARGGTPLKSNFDTYQDILIYRTKILELAGKKTGAKMPPSDIVPMDERKALIEYLNCGAPP